MKNLFHIAYHLKKNGPGHNKHPEPYKYIEKQLVIFHKRQSPPIAECTAVNDAHWNLLQNERYASACTTPALIFDVLSIHPKQRAASNLRCDSPEERTTASGCRLPDAASQHITQSRQVDEPRLAKGDQVLLGAAERALAVERIERAVNALFIDPAAGSIDLIRFQMLQSRRLFQQ